MPPTAIVSPSSKPPLVLLCEPRRDLTEVIAQPITRQLGSYTDFGAQLMLREIDGTQDDAEHQDKWYDNGRSEPGVVLIGEGRGFGWVGHGAPPPRLSLRGFVGGVGALVAIVQLAHFAALFALGAVLKAREAGVALAKLGKHFVHPRLLGHADGVQKFYSSHVGAFLSDEIIAPRAARGRGF